MYGEFIKLKIENMTEQHDAIVESNKAPGVEHSKYAIVSVAAGEGVVNMFKELRAEYIISGGQTMNPSTEDFVEMINSIKADHIIILPNNSNIIMAAKQAADILEDKDIRVIETKTIPQGLSACVMFNPDVDVDSNIEEMLEAVANTTTGQVTYSIKDTTFESIEIKENDFIGILEKDIVVTNVDRIAVTKALLEKLIKEESELVTLIYGEGVEADEVAEITDYIESNYDVEVESVDGKQPVYAYILGVE